MPHHPHLAEFLGAWFHQDYDLAGDTVEAVVDAYAASANAAQRQALADDIRAFIAETPPAELHTRFLRAFEPDVDPEGLAADTREFLERVVRRLTEARAG